MKPTLLLAVASLAIPIAALAQEQTAPPAPQAPAAQPAPMAPPSTPDEFVAQRQARMGRGGGALAQMKQVLDANGDLTTLAPRIQALTQWAQDLPTLFPEGSNTAASEARPEVWSDRAGFNTAAENFRTAVQALAAPAAANDHAAFATAWAAARATCGACHTGYKS